MAQSYKQLQKQIEALQKKADQLKAQEVGGVVNRIKVAIAHYGLTAEQLGFGAASTAARRAVASTKSAASSTEKYSDGMGHSWGGRGPRPQWLRDALAAGKTLDDFSTGTKPTSRVAGKEKSKSNGAGKRKTQVRFRDQAGNTWSGMGPRPRWLKEALAAGQPVEQLAA